MTFLLKAPFRVFMTLCLAGAAVFAASGLWTYYMDSPWTRDGRIRADVIRIAPDVSGLVSEVDISDNGHVEKGEILFRIDTKRFLIARDQAEAALEGARANSAQARITYARSSRLHEAATISEQQLDEARAALEQAEAAEGRARADLELAQLNIERSEVRAPVSGTVTNFSLRSGNYVATGQAIFALVSDTSFYVQGYFEETKLDRIHKGDRARMTLMGSSVPLLGHVEGIATAIEDRDRSDSTNLLANVNPTFSWVRLAQRVPVRIAIDDVPADLRLVAGRTTTVEILDGRNH